MKYCKSKNIEKKDISLRVSSGNIIPNLMSMGEVLRYKNLIDSIFRYSSLNRKGLHELTEDYSAKYDSNMSDLSENKSGNFCLYFTSVLEKEIYCEVFYDRRRDLPDSNDFRYYGSSLRFYVIFNESNNIVESFSEEVVYN